MITNKSTPKEIAHLKDNPSIYPVVLIKPYQMDDDYMVSVYSTKYSVPSYELGDGDVFAVDTLLTDWNASFFTVTELGKILSNSVDTKS